MQSVLSMCAFIRKSYHCYPVLRVQSAPPPLTLAMTQASLTEETTRLTEETASTADAGPYNPLYTPRWTSYRSSPDTPARLIPPRWTSYHSSADTHLVPGRATALLAQVHGIQDGRAGLGSGGVFLADRTLT